ncbi:unnamed protein product [Scytosiphon promiscuus]
MAFNIMSDRYMKLLPAGVTFELPVFFFKQTGMCEKLLDMFRPRCRRRLERR